LTKRLFERAGLLIGNVERWIPQIRQKQDLFRTRLEDDPETGKRRHSGGFDQIAVGWRDYPTTYIQTTIADRSGNHAAHRSSLLENPRLYEILAAGNGVLLISWGKRGPRGKRKLWTPRLEIFELGPRSGASVVSREIDREDAELEPA
jgi:hypothetical protein